MRTADLEDKLSEYEEVINDLKTAVEEQHEFIDKVTATPLLYASVAQIYKDAGKTRVVIIPFSPDASPREVEMISGGSLQEGDVVRVQAETSQIVQVVKGMTVYGDVSMITKVIDSTHIEVEYNGSQRVVVYPKDKLPLGKPGDRIVLSAGAVMALKNIGPMENTFKVSNVDAITWDHIGGLAEAKEQLIEAIEFPIKHKELYKRYGKKPLKGVLLYGPPGCGKTMLGKAAASSMQRLSGGDPKKGSNGFIYVKGPELLNMYVGNTEAAIRGLFASTRKFQEENGYRAVLFLDEADALLEKRGMGRSSDIERTIVPMFLAEMDGLNDSGALVLLSTNRPDVLDPAVVRDGRIDRKVLVSRPEKTAGKDIFMKHLVDKPLVQLNRTQMAEFAVNALYSPDNVLYEIKRRNGEGHAFTLADIASGAMIAGVIDNATSIAMKKDIAGRNTVGITTEDVTEAVKSVLTQNRDMNHDDDLASFIEQHSIDAVDVQKKVQSNGAVAAVSSN